MDQRLERLIEILRLIDRLPDDELRGLYCRLKAELNESEMRQVDIRLMIRDRHEEIAQ